MIGLKEENAEIAIIPHELARPAHIARDLTTHSIVGHGVRSQPFLSIIMGSPGGAPLRIRPEITSKLSSTPANFCI